MRGNGTARAGDKHLSSGGDLLDLCHALLPDRLVTARVGDENAVKLYVRAIAQTVADVFAQHRRKFAAVLFANAHFAAVYGDARLKLKQICPESRHGRASAALM